MAEVPPIQKTVDPKLSITSAEQALALEKAFDDEFGPIGASDDARQQPKPESRDRSVPAKAPEQDRDTEEHPPEEIPKGEEGRPATGQKDGRTDTAPEGIADGDALRHPDDEPDEEIDKFKVHPETRPETLDVFRDLRGMLKTERKKARELETRIKKEETERGIPRPVNDPSVQREMEELRAFRQKHQIFDDTTYQSQYENPIHETFGSIIADIKGISPDPEAAAEWEKQMRAAGPDRLDRRYWNEGVISQVADPLERDRLVRKVSTLLELQEKRNQFRQQIAEQPDAYEKFRHEQAASYWDTFGREAEDEMRKVTPTMGDWAAPRDPKTAKNATEKTAIEAHNAAYTQYEQLFKDFITDAATQGPRGMARISAKAVQGEKHRRDLESANKKITKLQADLESAREELNKIAGARSRVAQPSSASTNGATTQQGKRKASQSVDDAFKDFFGREGR